MNYATYSADQLRVVMENAKNRGNMEVYTMAKKLRYAAIYRESLETEEKATRLAEFESENRACLAVWEALQADRKEYKKYTATRTRLLEKNRGSIGALVYTIENNSFGSNVLFEEGLFEYSNEALIVKYADLFPEEIVVKCANRLDRAA
jgi:16S rRNA C967 or C1407 C5-methylase (RsmB/RsmF family)